IGYSREYKGPPLFRTNPLEEILPSIKERVFNAQSFWNKWGNPGEWNDFFNSRMDFLESHFGKYYKYFPIYGGLFPNKGLAVFEKNNPPSICAGA
ncbi:hypothetical protein N9Y92_04695, partial [Chlamydiales bacterium]|nr:hypothetical protein [Chlamydiales bacterium]